MTTKTCSRCKEEKSVTEFHKQRRSKDGLKSYCRSCAAEANRKCWVKGKGKKSSADTYKRAKLLEQGLRYCSICKQVLPTNSFGFDKRDKNNLTVNCKSCNSKRAVQYNPVGAKTKVEREQRNHYFRMASLKTKYGITEVDFQDMMNKQKGCCEICDKDFSELSTRAAVDHDHKTGQVRGLLCPNCNTLLGTIESNEHLLYNIVEYKDKYK